MKEPIYSDRLGCFEDYKKILTAIYSLAGGNPIIDLGVGEGHVTKHWDGVYVDLVVRPTAPAKTINANVLDAPKLFAGFSYNLMVMSDVIEHIKRPQAEQLLKDMEAICRAQFIFTPIGPWQIDVNSTHPDAHKSAWFPEEFSANGWEVLALPSYHVFSSECILGAFYAWKFRDAHTPTVKQILNLAGVPL